MKTFSDILYFIVAAQHAMCNSELFLLLIPRSKFRSMNVYQEHCRKCELYN